MNLQFALAALFGTLALLNLLAAWAIVRSGWFTKQQVIAQVILVFVVPFLGAIAALLFLRSQRPMVRQTEGADTDSWHKATGAQHADHLAP